MGTNEEKKLTDVLKLGLMVTVNKGYLALLSRILEKQAYLSKIC